MRKLIIIHTPYQLINALNIIETYNYSADLFFVHKNMEKYINNVFSYCNNVIYESFENENLRLCKKRFQKLNILLNIFTSKKKVKNKKISTNEYDELIVPSEDILCRSIYYCFERNNNLKLSLYDDGIGTYSNFTFRPKNRIVKLIYKTLYKKDMCDYISQIYVYDVELMSKHSNLNIKKIDNKIDYNSVFKDKIQKNKNFYINKKIIFLDQGLFKYTEIDECLSLLKKYFNKNEVGVKMHPRIFSNAKYDKFEKINDGLPFELVVNSLDFSNTIIMSHSSTGTLNSLTNDTKSPIVILLCFINPQNESQEDLELIKDYQLKYKNLFLPKTIDEFEMILVQNYNNIKCVEDK